jgi:aspartate kinase
LQYNENLQNDINYDIIITTGFIGKDKYNKITTLGRGGSDLSATLFAKALNPINVQIWSDVPGVMSSDPRYIKNTKLLDDISYNEALELSFFGAKILHPETLEPILETKIPLYILNTFDLNCDGTIIKDIKNKTEKNTNSIVKCISFNDNNSIIYIEPKNTFITNEFICNIFHTLNNTNIKCSMISFSKTSLSICIKTEYNTEKLLNKLLFNNTTKVSFQDKIGVICVVGESLYETQGIASKIFSTVSDCKSNIEMISQSVSQTNILFAIKQDNLVNVVQCIHDRFCL